MAVAHGRHVGAGGGVDHRPAQPGGTGAQTGRVAAEFGLNRDRVRHRGRVGQDLVDRQQLGIGVINPATSGKAKADQTGKAKVSGARHGAQNSAVQAKGKRPVPAALPPRGGLG